MRMIDADEFLERFESMCETPMDKMICLIVRGALRDEPTAYDVDKVVKQLREEFEKENEYASDEMIVNGHTLDFEYRSGRAYTFIRSAEIVKVGGTE